MQLKLQIKMPTANNWTNHVDPRNIYWNNSGSFQIIMVVMLAMIATSVLMMNTDKLSFFKKEVGQKVADKNFQEIARNHILLKSRLIESSNLNCTNTSAFDYSQMRTPSYVYEPNNPNWYETATLGPASYQTKLWCQELPNGQKLLSVVIYDQKNILAKDFATIGAAVVAVNACVGVVCNGSEIDPLQDGSGTVMDPYCLCSATQIDTMASLPPNTLALNFHLVADVDMALSSNKNGLNNRPFPLFTGNFNGNNKTISNWTNVAGNSGLFTQLGDWGTPGTAVRDLQFLRAVVSGNTGMLGALANKTIFANITNVQMSGTVQDDNAVDSYDRGVGGLVGNAIGTSFTNVALREVSLAFLDSTNVRSTGSIVGGVVGYLGHKFLQNNTNLALNPRPLNLPIGLPWPMRLGSVINGAQVQGVRVWNGDSAYTRGAGGYIGGIVGYAYDSPILNAKFQRLTTQGQYVFGGDLGRVGGIVGLMMNDPSRPAVTPGYPDLVMEQNSRLLFSNNECIGNIFIKASKSRMLGGLMGHGFRVLISRGFSNCTVEGEGSDSILPAEKRYWGMGGLAGHLQHSQLSNSEAAGLVDSHTSAVGGLVGQFGVLNGFDNLTSSNNNTSQCYDPADSVSTMNDPQFQLLHCTVDIPSDGSPYSSSENTLNGSRFSGSLRARNNGAPALSYLGFYGGLIGAVNFPLDYNFAMHVFDSSVVGDLQIQDTDVGTHHVGYLAGVGYGSTSGSVLNPSSIARSFFAGNVSLLQSFPLAYQDHHKVCMGAFLGAWNTGDVNLLLTVNGYFYAKELTMQNPQFKRCQRGAVLAPSTIPLDGITHPLDPIPPGPFFQFPFNVQPGSMDSFSEKTVADLAAINTYTSAGYTVQLSGDPFTGQAWKEPPDNPSLNPVRKFNEGKIIPQWCVPQLSVSNRVCRHQ